MTTVDETSRHAKGSVVDYAAPRHGRRHRFKHIVAIAFAVLALLLGSLFAVNAIYCYRRSVSEPTTIDKRLFLLDAEQFPACSLLLIVPAVWYGRAGIRGEPTAGDPPGTYPVETVDRRRQTWLAFGSGRSTRLTTDGFTECRARALWG